MKRLALTLALGASLVLPAAAFAADIAETPKIIVTGEGEASVKPDMALLTLTVMREAATAREAMDANNSATKDVVDALKAAGVAERDLQTAGVQIMPRYDYSNKPDGSQDAKLVAYQVSNTLSVRVRDLTKAGEILDKAVSLGVNQGGNIAFTNDNPAAAREEARKEAVANATAKAKTLAGAAGVELGKVLEISETSYAQPPMPMQARAIAAAADASGVPLQAGENTYTVQVNVTYELK